MEASLGVLAWVNALAFGTLAVAATRGWIRHRDRHWAALALAIGSLGVIAVMGRIAPALDHPRSLVPLSILVFQLSGWGLIQFRHSVIRYAERTRRLAAGALIVSGAAAIAADLPAGSAVPRTPVQFAVIAAVIAVWSACVAEPALRFWLEARGRMLVQRRRLRGLSLAYAGLSVVLLAAVTVHPDPNAFGFRMATQMTVLLLVPMMFAAVAPPAWLRRRWRRSEQGPMRAAIEGIVEATDERVLGAEGLEWGLRLLGSDTGFVWMNDHLIAARGLDRDEVAMLARELDAPGIHPVPTLEGRYAVVAPLRAGEQHGVIAVMAGRFSPVFGRDEVETLRELGASIARAVERLHLVQAVRQQSTRYETLLHAISDLGVGVSISRDARVVYANDAICSITGYDRDELLAMPSWSAMIPSEKREHVADQLVRLFTRAPGSEHWDSAIVRADGERRELEGSAKLLEIDGETHVLTISRDVTERVRATERDHRRAEQLDALARSSQRLASSRDPDLLLPAIAQAAVEVAGCETAAVCSMLPGRDTTWFGPNGAISIPPESVGILDVIIAEHRPIRASRAGSTLHRRTRIREILAVPVLRAGHLTGAILMVGPASGAFDDIDESVAVSLASYAAEVLESTRALTRERSMIRRLKELDEIKNAFLAAVSHELRTPLTSVLGFAHTLQRSGELLAQGERKHLVDRLAVNAEKLERLLADLLDLDRLNRGIVEPVIRTTDLGALVLRAAETYDFPNGRPVHVDVAPMEAAIDAPKVERIIENLLSNAVRHTTVTTPIWIRARREDDGVLIAVDDAGPGVPEHLRARIFEPFQQGPRNDHSPGVGIGLSLVARFASLHGGRAWVTDREGGGASFRVWLPGAVREPARTSSEA
ncbi:MAG TPA: ATP-binding protein [Actinomycetota bacterium]